jgi:DNA-binding Xre family transcriptional regulator
MNCKLKELMYERHLTQKEVAERTGLGYPTISRLYHNKADRFDKNTILTLCEFFKLTSINELLELEQ